MKTTTVKQVETFRVIVRGTNEKGKYVRRLKIVHGNYEAACKVLDEKFNVLRRGLKGEFINIKQVA